MSFSDPSHKRRQPMASADFKYLPDGRVDWGTMWETFCDLTLDGGPAHRSKLLEPDEASDPADPAYQTVVAELVRGIGAVSGLIATPAAAGWIAIHCRDAAHAAWLHEAIIAEGVRANSSDATVLVPAGVHYTIKGEIKNVITAVAKTTHYWREHLPISVKRALWLTNQLHRWRQWLRPTRPQAPQ